MDLSVSSEQLRGSVYNAVDSAWIWGCKILSGVSNINDLILGIDILLPIFLDCYFNLRYQNHLARRVRPCKFCGPSTLHR